MANVFDQFDAPTEQANPFDQFDAPSASQPTISDIMAANPNIAFYQEQLQNPNIPDEARRSFESNLDKEIRKTTAFEQLRSENPYLAQTLEETTGLEAAGVGFQRGLRDIARASGRLVGIPVFDESGDKQALDLLERFDERAKVGRAAGQAAPFLVPAAATTAIASLPARAATMSGIGATEGAAIQAGSGKGTKEVVTGS